MPVSWQPITSLYCVRTYYEPSDYRDLTVRAIIALVAALRHMPNLCVSLASYMFVHCRYCGEIGAWGFKCLVRSHTTRPALHRKYCLMGTVQQSALAPAILMLTP